MRIEAENPVCGRRGGAGWRAVTLVLLFAFSLQSFITQTHFHALSPVSGAKLALQAPHPGKSPLDEGGSACPFCQAAVHAGVFFAPASPELVLPASSIGVARFAGRHSSLERALAHAWRSRAPPQTGI